MAPEGKSRNHTPVAQVPHTETKLFLRCSRRTSIIILSQIKLARQIGFPLLLEASWPLTANEALAALAEEDVRPATVGSTIIFLHEHNSYSSGGGWPGQWQPLRSSWRYYIGSLVGRRSDAPRH
jgi:hypothetical protein